MKRKSRFVPFVVIFTGMASFSTFVNCGCLFAAAPAEVSPVIVEAVKPPCHGGASAQTPEARDEETCCGGCRLESALVRHAEMPAVTAEFSKINFSQHFLQVLNVSPGVDPVSPVLDEAFCSRTHGVCPGQPVFLATRHLLI